MLRLKPPHRLQILAPVQTLRVHQMTTNPDQKSHKHNACLAFWERNVFSKTVWNVDGVSQCNAIVREQRLGRNRMGAWSMVWQTLLSTKTERVCYKFYLECVFVCETMNLNGCVVTSWGVYTVGVHTCAEMICTKIGGVVARVLVYCNHKFAWNDESLIVE